MRSLVRGRFELLELIEVNSVLIDAIGAKAF
jgi:hypothetical protein